MLVKTVLLYSFDTTHMLFAHDLNIKITVLKPIDVTKQLPP